MLKTDNSIAILKALVAVIALLFSSPSVGATVSGYADAVTRSVNVFMPHQALGKPNQVAAVISFNGVLVLDLTDTVPEGKTFTIRAGRWSSAIAGAGASVEVSPTDASGSYSAAIPDTLTLIDRKLINFSFKVPSGSGGARYIKITMTSGAIKIDAISYSFTVDPDFGDAPDSYSTILPFGARHTIAGPYLGAVRPDAEPDGQPSVAADGDDTNPSGGPDDEDGVTFQSFADGTSATFQIDAHVTGVNPTGKNAMLCGYLDGAGNGTVDGSFSRDIVYSSAVGTLFGAVAGPGNEEVCIQIFHLTTAPENNITVTPDPANPGFHGASAKCDFPQVNGNFSCTFTFNPNFTTPVTTYARFRITTDPKFFSLTSPSPTGSAIDGEVEGFRLLVDPTAVTIGKVELQAVSAADFIAGLGIGTGDTTTLLALLTAWDPEAATELADAGAEEILSALNQYLDPDGDGQVAVLAWDTLEERGTIGFYVERQVGEGDWARINNDMLPGLITAPMGAEYQLADPGARAGTVYNYRLIEQEARGSTRTYGPYNVEMP